MGFSNPKKRAAIIICAIMHMLMVHRASISKQVGSRDTLPRFTRPYKTTARCFKELQAKALMRMSACEIQATGGVVDPRNAATPWSMSLTY